MQNGNNTHPNWQKIDPNTCVKYGDTWHKPGFECSASHYQWRKCQKYRHFVSWCLSKASKVNHINKSKSTKDELEYQQQAENDYSDEEVHTVNANSIENFHICNLKMQKWKGKNWVHASIQIYGTGNYLHTWVDTVADVNLMPASVYKQVYDDQKLQLLQPMDINLSVYNESTIWAFGTYTIPLISLVNRLKYKTKFYIANDDGSVAVKIHCTCSLWSHIHSFPSMCHTMDMSLAAITTRHT